MGGWPLVEMEGLWLWHGCDHYADYFQTTSIPSRLLLRPQATFLTAPLGGQVL